MFLTLSYCFRCSILPCEQSSENIMLPLQLIIRSDLMGLSSASELATMNSYKYSVHHRYFGIPPSTSLMSNIMPSSVLDAGISSCPGRKIIKRGAAACNGHQLVLYSHCYFSTLPVFICSTISIIPSNHSALSCNHLPEPAPDRSGNHEKGSLVVCGC
jgi:hypothetical protein